MHISGITILYVGVGLAAMASSVGYVILSVRANLRYRYESINDNSDDSLARYMPTFYHFKRSIQIIVHYSSSSGNTTRTIDNSKLLIGLMISFTFLYVGIEGIYSMFLATYAVKSELHLSEVEGSNLSAFHGGSLALSRCYSSMALFFA